MYFFLRAFSPKKNWGKTLVFPQTPLALIGVIKRFALVAGALVCRSTPPALRATSPSRGSHPTPPLPFVRQKEAKSVDASRVVFRQAERLPCTPFIYSAKSRNAFPPTRPTTTPTPDYSRRSRRQHPEARRQNTAPYTALIAAAYPRTSR